MFKEWTQLGSDPTSSIIHRARQKNLESLRVAELVQDRLEFICKLCAGKRVLDVGVVEHDLRFTFSPNWLHGAICRVAAECHGVDILPDAIAELQRRGFSVSCDDLVERPLSTTFDVIVCGEVIEHIDQPGVFLTNCRTMLAEDGLLILTTPNPWYANVILKAAFARGPFQDSADHVAWYDPSTLYELGGRCGLDLCHYRGVAVTNAKGWLPRVFFGLSKLWIRCGFRSEVLAKTLIYEFKAGRRAG